MTYKATALGVTILFVEGQNIDWFIEQAISKGGVINIERYDECEG